MKFFAFLLAAAIVVVASPCPALSRTAAQEKKPVEHTPKPQTPPLDIVVPMPPQAFKAGGKWNLCYELHAVNYGKWDAALTRLQIVSDDASAKVLADYSDAALYLLLSRPGLDTVKKEVIGPGAVAVIYLWVTLDRLEDVPARLCHRIAMRIGDYPEAITLEGVPLAVNKSPVPVIGAPLEGDNWLAGNGPSNTSAHRRALIPINGRADISQRYAIDWVRLNPDGKTYSGDSTENKNYRAYGAEIHAVADGVVTQIKDGIQQNIPGDTRAVPMTLETIGGNHVIVEIADGAFAFYAHMQPGSLRVKIGDHVRRGQVLGLVGNSGNSTEPHLHFHLCTANSELGSEGLPYAFASFDLQGNGWSYKSSESKSSPVKLEMQIPIENDVVRFVRSLSELFPTVGAGLRSVFWIPTHRDPPASIAWQDSQPSAGFVAARVLRPALFCGADRFSSAMRCSMLGRHRPKHVSEWRRRMILRKKSMDALEKKDGSGLIEAVVNDLGQLPVAPSTRSL